MPINPLLKRVQERIGEGGEGGRGGGVHKYIHQYNKYIINTLENIFITRLYLIVRFPGGSYMVVDCGGGTVDITVHQISTDGSQLREVFKATGGPYGSVSKSF